MRAEDSRSLLLAGLALAGGLALAAWAPAAGSWGAWRAMPDLAAWSPAPGAGGGTQGHRAGHPAGTQRLARGQGRWVPAGGGQAAGSQALGPKPARGLGLASGMGPAGRAFSGGGKPSLAGPLDLNRASAPALTALPGVGPTLARRIVAHREAHGPFRQPEDLTEVPGIGPKRYARLKDWITVR